MRGTFAGAFKKKLGLTIVSDKRRAASGRTASPDQKDRERGQAALGFSIEQRVTTGVATINPKEPEMNTTTQIPATQNEAWGFWGTMNEHASAAWPWR